MNHLIKYIKYKIMKDENWQILLLCFWLGSTITLMVSSFITQSLPLVIIAVTVFAFPPGIFGLYYLVRYIRNWVIHQYWDYKNWKSQFTSSTETGNKEAK